MSNTNTEKQSVESKYPIAIFELIPASKNGAGFVREDTIGTAHPVTIIHPKNRVIINESVVKKPSKLDPKVMVNVFTRYVYGQEVIDKNDQAAQNIQPNVKSDKIVFINGFLTVPKDGAFVGLYNFMINHAQNLTNTSRLENLKPLFREIKPAEAAHDQNFSEFAQAEAIGYIRALVTETKGVYVYNEERLEALSQLFNVAGESIEAKTKGLIAFAKTKPVLFLKTAKENEQTVAIEVKHALALKLITFEGNTAIYTDKNEKIKSFPGRLAEDKQADALASFFQIVEGKEAYEVFKARLEAAKEAVI